jgi:hypothetical protein
MTMTDFAHRLPLSLLLLAVATGAGTTAASAAPTELRFTKLNRVYQDLAGDMAPLSYDPVTVKLSSPRQTVLVKDNRITLTPLGGGRFSGRVEIDFLGKGDLVADVDLGGHTQHLADEVLLPPQHLTLDGVARIDRVDGGYRVTSEQLPASLPVEIRSKLVNDLLGICSGAALLSLGSLDCAPLEKGLERPSLPMPAAGSVFFLADADLTDDDRAALDGLLAAP